MATLTFQRPLGREYTGLSEAETLERIARAKEALGSDLLILGHHYQREEVIRFADYRGDSLKLAREAANRPEARYIVFCGVHFMAETADILKPGDQAVILPNLSAGCSMADMADIDQVTDCWDQISPFIGDELTPITYVNSTAALKGFVGDHGGAVCTSSNAQAILKWALAQRPRVLFFPDQHLGRNSAVAMGYSTDEMIVWDPYQPMGGNTEEAVRAARFVLWKGHCSVHGRFTAAQIAAARARHPSVRIVVHPECPMDVVQAADANGSTEFIAKYVRESPAGSVIGVGTEINLVNRLAREMPDKTIFCLDPVVCPCSTMYRIHPSFLLWTLENLLEGKVVNRITVPEPIRSSARLALERMLAS
ncbi:MAG TPA: quinolinate synthase NadA [Armatimonadota bacterium]|jgi:quinolinate synthase